MPQTGSQEQGLTSVPGLTWRGPGGVVTVNPLASPPDDLDHLVLDYSAVLRSSARHFDILSPLPFQDYLRYPITAVLSVKGCVHGCRTCGGSKAAFARLHGRRRPAFRSPERLASDIHSVGRFSRGPVFVLGDLMQAGPEYLERFCSKVTGFKGPVTMEFFDAAHPEGVEALATALPGLTLQVSMESHDPKVRKAFGRADYTNEQMEALMTAAFEAGISRLDLFFMVGLPEQDLDSVMETIEYSGRLMDRYQKYAPQKPCPLIPFISPLAPFLDPGSEVFNKPSRYGYELLCKTLEEHRRALSAPSWKLMLNYRTRWLSRQEIVEATYRAQARLVGFKAEHGQATPEEAQRTSRLVEEDLELMALIDEAMAMPESQQAARLAELAPRIEALNRAGIKVKERLKISHRAGPIGFPFKIGYMMGVALRTLLERRKPVK